MMVLERRWALLSVVTGLLFAQACYDHSYTQAIKARRAAAEHAKGAEVTAGGELRRPIEYEATVRVYASPEYRSNRGGWAKRITDLVDATAPILGPAFAVRLEVVDTFSWQPACDQRDLQSCVEELVAHDPGDDVDWVVGFVGAQPRFTANFEELGMALTPSQHFVMRDLYDAGERAQIDAVFASMTQAKRTEIYRERQKHKRLVVFLHEWAHTLGAMHVRNDAFILYPAYDDEMALFSEENLRLVDAALRDRFPPSHDHANLREYLTATESEAWFPGQRDHLLAIIGGPAPSARQSAAQSGGSKLALPGETKQLLAGVGSKDQDRYDQAVQRAAQNDYADAWAILSPLIAAYPDNYAVQHFACGLAMSVGASSQAGEACRRSIELMAESDTSR